MGIVKRVGRLFGRHALKVGIEYLQKKVKRFHIQYFGIQFLKELEDQPYLLAANHIKPEDRISQGLGLSQDAFVLERIVLEQTGRRLRIISKCDNGWWAKDLLFRFFQKCIIQPFGEGMNEGAGMIPIRKNPGSFNRNFLKVLESIVQKKEPILIFPEGDWYEDFSSENTIESGVAHIALKHNLPIIPAYVRGCSSWKPRGGKIDLIFGPSFQSAGKTRENIKSEIKERIANLQHQIIK